MIILYITPFKKPKVALQSSTSTHTHTHTHTQKEQYTTVHNKTTTNNTDKRQHKEQMTVLVKQGNEVN